MIGDAKLIDGTTFYFGSKRSHVAEGSLRGRQRIAEDAVAHGCLDAVSCFSDNFIIDAWGGIGPVDEIFRALEEASEDGVVEVSEAELEIVAVHHHCWQIVAITTAVRAGVEEVFQ